MTQFYIKINTQFTLVSIVNGGVLYTDREYSSLDTVVYLLLNVELSYEHTAMQMKFLQWAELSPSNKPQPISPYQ